MSLRSAVVMIALFAVGAAPVAAQSIAGAAKPIGEEREESEALVIDNASLAKASASRRPPTEGNWLLDSAQECVESIKDLNVVLAETATGNVFFDPDWRRRVVDGAVRFRLAQSDLTMIDPDPRYTRSLDLLEDGVDAAELSVVSVLAAIERDQPLYATPKKDLIQAQRMLEAAYADLRADHRAEMAEEPAPFIDPIAADRSINRLCGQRYGSGSDALSSCVAGQKAAIDAITLRSGPGFGLDAASFNSIRNGCRFEYPDDFVGRNRCELQRMTAKTSQ